MSEKLTIKQHRLIRGITQNQMAEALHVSKPTYVRIEKNSDKATMSQVKAICKILEINIEQIFFAH